jgi:hypothetical protein
MKIMRAIFAFIIYGILASLIVYTIEKYIPFITLKYNIIYFILIAAFITAFTFLLENSKTKKMGYIFLGLLFASYLAYLLYLVLNAITFVNMESFTFGVDYSLIMLLLIIPLVLRISGRFFEIRSKN